MTNDDLTHTTDEGDVQMVDVGDKPDTARRAVAEGTIHLQPSTVAAIRGDEVGKGDDAVGKGDVLATARVAAVQAVKHTWETVPMCHQIPITNVETEFDVADGDVTDGDVADGDVTDDSVTLRVAVETTGKTGCEMEALQGVSTGLNTVWDMVKAAEKDADGQYPDTHVSDVRVVDKEKRPLE